MAEAGLFVAERKDGKMKITIEKGKKGWIVECGCQRIEFKSTENDLFLMALLEYVSNPSDTVEKYEQVWKDRLTAKYHISDSERLAYMQQSQQNGMLGSYNSYPCTF